MKTILENKTLDLTVERYQFKTDPAKSENKALRMAAERAEIILYKDIWGALELDLNIHWSKSPPYPNPAKVNDGHSVWQPKWFIPPHEYESKIRWKPLDQMQQFDVQTSAVEKNDSYQGIVSVDAYIWNDKISGRGDGRFGCLLDLTHRNKDRILLAETADVTIPMNINDLTSINNTYYMLWKDNMALFGFEFPPNEIGDISYKEFSFASIDIEKRTEECRYRDR